jgi:hypothetical protein
MKHYAPIKMLSDMTGLNEKTIRRMIVRQSIPCHRPTPHGKILVDVEAFARYMESTKVEVKQDQLVTGILKELRDFMRR